MRLDAVKGKINIASLALISKLNKRKWDVPVVVAKIVREGDDAEVKIKNK